MTHYDVVSFHGDPAGEMLATRAAAVEAVKALYSTGESPAGSFHILERDDDGSVIARYSVDEEIGLIEVSAPDGRTVVLPVEAAAAR